MNQALASGIVVICIFATFGTTYAFVNAYKDQETFELKAEYEHNISNLNSNIASLNAQIENLIKEDEEDIFTGGIWSDQYFSGYGFFPNGGYMSTDLIRNTDNFHGVWELDDEQLILKYRWFMNGTKTVKTYDYSISNVGEIPKLTLIDTKSGISLDYFRINEYIE